MGQVVTLLDGLIQKLQVTIQFVKNVEIVNPYLGDRAKHAESERHGHVCGDGLPVLHIYSKAPSYRLLYELLRLGEAGNRESDCG